MSLQSVVARVAELNSLVGAGSAHAASRRMPADFAAVAALGDARRVGGIPGRFVAVLDAAQTPAAQPPANQNWAAPVQPAPGEPSAPAATGAAFLAPLAGATLTQAFGPTSFELEPAATVDGIHYAHYHDGLDLAAPLGTPVCAAAAGTVISAGPGYGGAVIVRIRHDDGTVSLYGHLQTSLAVKAGDRVAAGQQIGSVGITGNTTGPHLHFGLFGTDGVAIDPQPYLDAGRLPGAAAAGPASASTPPASTGSPSTLASPTPTDPASMTSQTTQAVLARFDAISARIPYAAQIRAAAVNAGIDPLLLASLVHAESDFQPKAVSSCGAMGLTQLMPATARYLGVGDPFDPAQNLRGGARYLAEQLKQFGRVDYALAAYQAGPGAVASAGGVPNYPSTKQYVAHVLSTWAGYAEPSI